MKNQLIQTIAALGALALAGPASAATTFLATIDNNLRTAGNWSNGIPAVGNDGTIAIDGTTAGSGFADWGGATVIQTAGTWTCTTDFGPRAVSYTMNGGTITAVDDVFAHTGTFTFNAGSTVIANDLFWANASGTLIINGGTHTAKRFGSDASAFANVLGGTITAGTNGIVLSGVANTIGGSAVISTTGNMSGANVDVLSGWTGSLTVGGMTDWKAYVTSGWTLDNVAIDSTSFDNNFSVTGNTLTVIPEPSSLALLGLGGLALLRRRRK